MLGITLQNNMFIYLNVTPRGEVITVYRGDYRFLPFTGLGQLKWRFVPLYTVVSLYQASREPLLNPQAPLGLGASA